ncbi:MULTISPECIES: magnesium/cobalt transporter CorA [Calditerrivibrio]|uniref:Magnesium transport protein CorA n=1 Tax=Calditerrivibrio nitroreducens TaxID=477976 RepID=A0A2J6WNX8_9BACT|nr:MAG: magnesium and cobalt transport protein CorA [Calditerrivibrio nitroreducens]
MVKIYAFVNSHFKVFNLSEDNIDDIPSKDELIWVDMFSPSSDEFRFLEKYYEIEFPTKQETEEIEISSRYWESDKDITINSYFLVVDGDAGHNETVTFILQDNFLVTIRYRELKTFGECLRKMIANPSSFKDGSYIMSSIFEARIDLDADILENLSRNVSNLRKKLFANDIADEDILESIYHYENLNTNIRDSLIDKQRIISSLLKSRKLSDVIKDNFRIMIKDVNSLIDFTRYNFDRLDYIQNIFLGLLNIEQNKVIKIFTVVNVIFLPPTLVASVYGMNFEFFPELHWRYGYLLAWVLMIASAILPVYIFKKKGWM